MLRRPESLPLEPQATSEAPRSSRPTLNLPGTALLSLLSGIGCTETTVVNNYYTVPEAEEASEFVSPDACGITPTATTAELPAVPFYGPEADGAKIAILVEQDELDLANTLVNTSDTYADGWIDYVPGEGSDEDMEDEAVATVCFTPADESMTVCAEVPFKLVGGMTRTEWHGTGEGDIASLGLTPTIPSINLDLNSVDPDFKIKDSSTGRDIDNVRVNSGQFLGLPSAAISYLLAKEHGVVERPTSYVNIVSNVWGLDALTGDCVSVPELNVMRDQNGNVCEVNEDGLMGDCAYGLEGYTLSSPSDFVCEWAKGDFEDCDTTSFNEFASAVNDNVYTSNFSGAVDPYVNEDRVLTMLADEFVQGFTDGYRVGNNNVWAATVQDGQVKYHPEPYSRDLALLGSSYYWMDLSWGDNILMGYLNDPATCPLLLEKIRTMNSTMEADCMAAVETEFDRLVNAGAYRGSDAEVRDNKEYFCTSYPPALESALVEFEAYCASLSAGDTGGDTAWADTAAGL